MKIKESKIERDARIKFSDNMRKTRTRIIPNKKKNFDFKDLFEEE